MYCLKLVICAGTPQSEPIEIRGPTMGKVSRERGPTIADSELSGIPHVARVTTPEGVLLELRLAGVATRLFARLLDLVIMGILLTVVGLLVSLVLGSLVSSIYLLQVLSAIVLFLILFVYPTVSEVLWGGTPGKKAFRIKVVTIEGGSVATSHAFIRSLLLLPDFLVGFFLLIGTKNAQRLGDLAAGTLIVREERAFAEGFYFPPAYGAEEYAQLLDASRLSPDQYALARDFLLRAKDLSKDARFHLSTIVAQKVAEATTNPIPEGLDGERYIQANVYAYQSKYYESFDAGY